MSSSSIASSTTPAPKQIRFVNNEGHPPAKRRRINAACRTCRKRKTRCDGKKPLCSTCVNNGHECLGYADTAEPGASRENAAASLRSGEGDRDSEDDDRRIASRALKGTPQSAASATSPYFNASKGRSIGLPRVKVEEETKHSIPDVATTHREASTMVAQSPSSGDADSPPARNEGLRVPYFRYFGPTAIVPGYKQMVVAVHPKADRAGSATAISPGSGGHGSVHGGFTPSQASFDERSSTETPAYDPGDPLPVHRLIIHLVATFFTHLGCNYPFLKKERFQRAVEDKLVDAILVDSVCSLAARFSDHPLLTLSKNPKYPKSEHGRVFARRAKMALVDTFPCPSVSSVQACLLLAYEGFGSNQDSALWMQLGCAIRMAQDLGLNKLQGVKPDEKPQDARTDLASSSERKEIDQERLDTLWAVFMLDRVISSGTGRPVTLKDADFELSFPDMSSNPTGDWPDPFPALIQIIHLYGRVTDLINNIRDVKDATQEKMEGLAGLENDLTKIYQKLDQRLTFSASNFQHYVKSGQGTNFILVHFWFHTLIMLLHQPTLLHSLEGGIHQLLPNSRELSMSSAKTIADILAFAELIDPKSFIGNPFVSQPIYIAAGAFLMETAVHTSQPTSRDATPQDSGNHVRFSNGTGSVNQKQPTKHTLLATAANQNYQRCYNALEQLEKYWAGTRYLLTALDQKAKGIWDPETYTLEEMESTKIKPDVSLATQNWRRKMGTGFAAQSPKNVFSPTQEMPGSPAMDLSQAIGWSLTGTTNSPSSNLAFLYQPASSDQNNNVAPHHVPSVSTPYYDPIRQSHPESAPTIHMPTYNQSSQSMFHSQQHHSSHKMPPPGTKYSSMSSDAVSTSDAEMLLGLQHSSYSHNTPGRSGPQRNSSYDLGLNSAMATNTRPNNQERHYQSYGLSNTQERIPFAGNGYMGMNGIGDMTIESQDIHMSALAPDMGTWLEYLPQDVINFFDSSSPDETHRGAGMDRR